MAYQCTLKQGKSVADVNQANAVRLKSVEAAKATDPTLAEFSAYMLTPWIANTPYDVVYLVVNDDLESFGKINTAALTSSDGQEVGAAFDAVMSCESGLFDGKAVRQPAPAE